MIEAAAKFEEGALWWKGSGPEWFWKTPEEMHRLADALESRGVDHMARDVRLALEAYEEEYV